MVLSVKNFKAFFSAISGHLNIGSDVQIGGGSGVIKNIPNNSKVMGYPATDLRRFIKENK